jgi:poly(3-hydroxybutyrate) depolymerase
MRTDPSRGFEAGVWGLLMAVMALLVAPAQAEVQQKIGTFAGMQVTYRVILPNNYDATKAYPTILHFAGGGQTVQIVARSTETDWRATAERQGYIVISPAAPEGRLFFEEGARIFPAFIDQILKSYRVAGGKLHVTGHSNGGLSAFHVASLFPQYFISVTGYPGLLDNAPAARLAALQPLCLYMHVGEQDTSWLRAMQAEYALMRQRGANIRFAVEKGQGHRLDVTRDNLLNRLVAGIERARNGCTGG